MPEPWDVSTIALYIRECFVGAVNPVDKCAITSKMEIIHEKINEKRSQILVEERKSQLLSAGVDQRELSAHTLVL